MNSDRHSRDDEMIADVIVVGFGPTGMSLAALLGQQGLDVVVLERYEGLYNLPRAAAFDDETMRTFQKLGVAEKMIPGTNVQPGYTWVNGNDDVLMDIEFENPGRCGWPSQYMMYQPHVETVLHDLVESLPNVRVHRGTRVVGLTQDATGVAVTATAPDGADRHVRGRYLVGCDGGSGFVREALGVGLDDYGFFENWLVCDFHLRREVPGLPTFRQVCNPAEPIAIVNIGPRYHRFSFRLEAETSREEATHAERVWERVSEYLHPEDADLVRTANYTFRSAIAERWRTGRVLLAGDAAHQMPPFLAQGMVSGIRDARNLAWKLGMVLAGHSDELLNSYQEEREPHVRFITEKAIELGRVQTMRDVEEAKRRDARMIAARQANERPVKLVYPALSGGLVSSGGDLFPQGLVSSPERTALLDDVVGTGWLMVANGAPVLDSLSQATRDAFAALGGREVTFGLTSMFEPADLSDTGGVYARWFTGTGCAAVIVRPDSYIYGLARDADELAALTKELLGQLAVPV
ncbi:bifunctional 3-(3-hydroxy-phenyl)propionate/3-hydroxycinnamic acid hydroxylase [Nocardioides eburneiflavus]|uniref:Bifunctional 3-(3-hydroxy-phenyl)propionate/3-hydroxycinnamic acid hydroxylase n=1 Tax=Nocardioides eburneiflavus TaxID=2518372 RepID=A0A4Z1CKW6_9ACTN|nr:bifunctional 3-(3-hydroxy-phenyl)propionate/3-hydroxycinnamic acid hydroxylase [Nocardioides eburneiflavus]TGN65120.1 bifunctional 3-(3-hydroxy-phenyl)propionate/3-hydroxycinnamic acid hydroxylase [Nocardioides eburneiflavus]